jgi:hypothetical protein
MLPPDAITFVQELVGAKTVDIITASSINPVTVLSIKIQQSGSQSETIIYCGTDQIARNYARDYNLDLLNYVCTDVLKVVKTGTGDSAFVSLSYVPYNRVETVSTIGTAPPFSLLHSYTFGELTISLILIPLFAIALYRTILLAFRKPIRFSK